ncbi:MAG: peptidase M16 [Coxiella sp. DG_40]|nr:MAG: peptidase M16 [Coxiella sp. DG_40]
MRLLTILILIIGFVFPAYSDTGKVSEYKLPNGLKLIVKEDHRAPIIVSQIWYKVGASYEPDGISGISHALEHMMFRGTKKYGPGVLKKIIADNGGAINAMTDCDYTMYYEVLAADKLPLAFELEADRMHGLLLDPQLFEKELQVILEEWRMRTQDNPQAKTYERFAAVANISSPYRRPVIGWHSDIQHLTVQDLRHWYQTWYAPNNAIIVVVGDVQPNQVYRLAEEYFAPLKANIIPQLKPQLEQQPLGERTLVVNAHAELPWLIMGYNVPTLKTADKEWKAYALEAASAILATGNSSRLAKQLIRGQQVAVAADADYPLYGRLDGLFLLEGTPAPKHGVKQLQQAFLQQIRQLQTTLVTKEELARIKAQLIASKVYNKDSIENQAAEIGSLEAVNLSWHEADQYIRHIEAVTPQQIQDVAKQYLVKDRLTIGVLQPLKSRDKNAH